MALGAYQHATVVSSARHASSVFAGPRIRSTSRPFAIDDKLSMLVTQAPGHPLGLVRLDLVRSSRTVVVSGTTIT